MDKLCSVDGCGRVEQLRKGLCKKHYRRVQVGGDPEFLKQCDSSWTLRERFKFIGWDEVSGPLDTPCWRFRSPNSDIEYGRITVNGKRHSAHRISYELYKGAIPEGLLIRHRCDNRFCVNPDHLEAGTPKDNMQDCLDRGRHNPPRGSRNGRSKLDDATVLQIYREATKPGRVRVQVAREFGVSPSLVSSIANGTRWGHLTGAGH